MSSYVRASPHPIRPLVALAVAGAVSLSSCTGPGPPPLNPVVGGIAGPLGIRLAKVAGVALKGRPARGPLMEPAEQIRRTISLMYTAGFVDPAQWRAGFPGVLDAFAPDSRGRARDDLNQLSLGGSARSLVSVTPTDARIVVRFLPDQKRRPVAALADMRFQAVGIGDGFEVPIHHEGDYLMRRIDGRWLVAGYDVRGRVGS
ncbi:MAG: hypothetical protein ACRDHM_00210 [Actinomycetota bacterium]